VVIVADFDIKGIAVAEAKAQTPLIVDPDRVLADAIACQGFEPVRLRPSQIFKSRRSVQLTEPHLSALENVRRQSACPCR
jgi:hypothetical protein